MAPQLSISSQSILDRLRGLTNPGSVASPGANSVDSLLNSYAAAAAPADPVLDGNDPLQEYLNSGTPTAPTATNTNPIGITGQPGPRTNDFAPVGIANDDQWHNLGGNIMEHQLNSNHNPRDVALFWGRKLAGVGDGSIKNATPVGNRIGDDTPLTYNYPNFDAFVKDGAKTSQLPPQAYSGAGAGQIGGSSGGNSSSVMPGSMQPGMQPGMQTSPTGAYLSSNPLLQQYSQSAPGAQPQQNVGMGNAIQQRLARLRGAV